MLNIFVLEDDFLQQTRIETAIKKCMTDHHLKYKYLEVFGKPTQLLEAIKETGNCTDPKKLDNKFKQRI